VKAAESPFRGRNDAELVAACCAGHKAAFGELVARHQDRIFNLAFRLTGNRDDAAEVAQEAFLKAYGALKSFRRESAFGTWVFRIAVNTARSRRRFRAVRPAELSLQTVKDRNDGTKGTRAPIEDIAARDPGPDEEASRAERRRIVGQAVARMDEEQRIMIVLRDIEGRDYGEIADLLDCPRGTVKSRLHRARMALKDILSGMLGDEFVASGSG
jgi:RNA polymerase sigma-70 factor (ECF subfamily)